MARGGWFLGLGAAASQPVEHFPVRGILLRKVADQLENRVANLLKQRRVLALRLLAELRLAHKVSDHLRDAFAPGKVGVRLDLMNHAKLGSQCVRRQCVAWRFGDALQFRYEYHTTLDQVPGAETAHP